MATDKSFDVVLRQAFGAGVRAADPQHGPGCVVCEERFKAFRDNLVEASDGN